jgi:photosystem II stability/assembly factor-like uncharacterized protein
MRQILRVMILAALLAPTCPLVSAAEKLDWTCAGPWGGFIFRVQVDDQDRVLAYTSRGNYLSMDRGVTWNLIRQAHDPVNSAAMVLSRGRLWLAGGGILFSTATGEQEWEPRGKLPGRLLGHARIPGDPPRSVWAAVRSEAEGGSSIHVLATGQESRKIGEIPDQDFRLDQREALRAHPAAPTRLRLVLSVYDKGLTWIFGSEDAGKTWVRWSVPLCMNSLVPVPGRPDEWLAASYPLEGKPHGVVRSVDGGRTWKELAGDARLRKIRTLTFHPSTGGLLLGSYGEGVFQSADLGKTLIPRGEGLGAAGICSIAVDPRPDGRLYAGTQAGLYRSDDGGKTWTWASVGMAALQSTGLHALPGNRVMLLEFQQGARISTDGGRTWPAYVPGWKEMHGRAFWGFVCGDVVYVNTGGAKTDGAVSRDAGRTWATSELSPREWLLGVLGQDAFFAARDDGSILRSRDGIRFEKISDRPESLKALPMRIALLAGKRAVILSETEMAGFDAESGKVGPAMPVPEGIAPQSAVVDPVDRTTLWIGTRDGRLHRRTFPDGEWRCALDRQGECLLGLVADPKRKGRRIACFSDGAVLISENGGADWKPLENPQRFRVAKAIAVTADRRLLVIADGSVRALELSSLDE